MAVEALWSVKFGNVGLEQYPVNGGVVVMETNRILGGDSLFAYVGSYSVSGRDVSGTIRVVRHHHDPGSIDAWGTGEDDFEITFAGVASTDAKSIEGRMRKAGRPDIGLRLNRIAELP